jgi:hypothetical protein
VRKRKVTYPAPKTSNRPAPPPGAGPEPRYERPTVATIDLNAGVGRPGLSIGSRVRITGSGLYSDELAVIERFATGVIPSAYVRTDGGKSRQVRTIDLEPVGPDAVSKPAERPADKPTEQPADKPTEPPADKLAEQPAEQPADKPVA